VSVVHYIAIVEGGRSGFGVFFPDLPGCTSAGDTLEEAVRNAPVALNLHLEGMAEDGEAIPEPSSVDTIKIDSDVREVARLLVRGEIAPRAARVNVSLPVTVLAALDAIAAERDLDRSAMIADLVRQVAGTLQGKARRSKPPSRKRRHASPKTPGRRAPDHG
jgi:predicted RNase H-like HicB family nuclease